MIRFDKTHLDPAILLTLFDHGALETYVVRNWLDSPETMRFHRVGLKTSHVRTALRRLEKAGLVESADSRYQTNMLCWSLTPAGIISATAELERRR